MLIRYAYNSYRISMSYDVYRVKNVQKKIADFEHPSCRGKRMRQGNMKLKKTGIDSIK